MIKFKLSSTGKTIKLNRLTLEKFLKSKKQSKNSWQKLSSKKEVMLNYPLEVQKPIVRAWTKNDIQLLAKHKRLRQLIKSYREFLLKIDQHNLQSDFKQTSLLDKAILNLQRFILKEAVANNSGKECIFGGWISETVVANSGKEYCRHPWYYNKKKYNGGDCGYPNFLCNPVLFGKSVKSPPTGVSSTKSGICIAANLHNKYKQATELCFKYSDGNLDEITKAIVADPNEFIKLTNSVEDFCNVHEIGIANGQNNYNACVYLRSKVASA